MNYNMNNMNINQTTFQRVLTQPCFKCQGEGKLYPFEGKKGVPSNCNVCSGGGIIDGSYVCCHWCKGEAKVYPFDYKGEISSDCYICQGKGYLSEPLELCQFCNGEGKTYPFAGRKGVPSDCNKCLGKGGVPVSKKYLVNTTSGYNQGYEGYNSMNTSNQSQYPGQSQSQGYPNMNNYNNPNQNSNFNNSNFNQPSSTNMITTSFEPMQNSQNLIPNNSGFQPLITNYSEPFINPTFNPLHNHPLSQGILSNYTCNACDQPFSCVISHQCRSCDFDACSSCVSRIKKPENRNVHPHPLFATRRQGNWFCNVCNSSHKKDSISWYCQNCDFDACIICYYPY